MRTLLLLLSLFPCAALAVALANKNATQATVNLYNYIAALPERSAKRVISGQEVGSANPPQNIYSAAQGYPLYVTNLKTATGILVGMAGFDYSADTTPAYKFPQLTDPKTLTTINTTIINHWNQGGIVTVMSGSSNPWTGGNANDVSTNGKRLTDAITPGTAAYANWIAQLDAVAAGLKQLQDAGVVVLWRPLHEMNGRWFWWGAAAIPQDYKDLWQHMFNYFTYTKNLNNLIWVYAASSGVTNAQDSVNSYYPGTNFVDIVGIDGYKDTIDSAIISSYNSLLQNSKPFALAEFGPATPPGGTLSTSGTFDFSSLITSIKTYLPKTSYFMAWADCPTCSPKVNWSMVSNLNSKALLSDPWVVNASDLAIDLQNLSLAAPGPPTTVTGIAGNAKASVSFVAPVSNGGSPITGYTVTANPGGKTGTGAASPIVVAELTNGSSYTFTVTATNSAGTSPNSTASNAVTPSVTAPSDCLFNWAEVTYPTLFAPAVASNTLAPYYYRYYAQTRAYLATSSADNHVYYLGPVSNNAILDVGPLSTWRATAGCQ
jgi:mannan endo-1,4-beta-mannosidase